MDHSLAMFAASQIWPWLAAPSPYMATDMVVGHAFFARYMLAKPRPTPTGTCAPTMPLPPQNRRALE